MYPFVIFYLVWEFEKIVANVAWIWTIITVGSHVQCKNLPCVEIPVTDVTLELPVNILMELHTCTVPESLPTLTAYNPFLVECTNSTATGTSINLHFVLWVPEVLKVSGFVKILCTFRFLPNIVLQLSWPSLANLRRNVQLVHSENACQIPHPWCISYSPWYDGLVIRENTMLFSWMKKKHSTRYLYITPVVQLCHMIYCIIHKCIHLSIMLSHKLTRIMEKCK